MSHTGVREVSRGKTIMTGTFLSRAAYQLSNQRLPWVTARPKTPGDHVWSPGFTHHSSRPHGAAVFSFLSFFFNIQYIFLYLFFLSRYTYASTKSEKQNRIKAGRGLKRYTQKAPVTPVTVTQGPPFSCETCGRSGAMKSTL